MQGSDKNSPSAFEMGLVSITSLLGEIGKNTSKGNVFLENLSLNVDRIFNFLESGLSRNLPALSPSNINIQSKNDITLLRIESYTADISETLMTISNDLHSLVLKFNAHGNNTKDVSDNKVVKTVAKVSDMFFGKKGNTIIAGDTGQHQELISTLYFTNESSNNWLETISLQLEKIYKYLPKLSNKPQDIANTSQNIDEKTFDFSNLARGVNSMKKSLTKGFISNFKAFMKILTEFLDFDTKKLTYIGITLRIFGLALFALGTQTDNLRRNFNKLSVSILILSLLLISPPFILGAAILVGVIWAISKAISKNIQVNWGFAKLTQGILMLVLAMALMKNIPFESVIKTIMLIGLLGLVIQNFGGDSSSAFSMSLKGGISKSSSGNGIRGMVGFAFGITILVLAMLALEEIPYTSIFKMIGFIALLGVTLKIFMGGKKLSTPGAPPLFLSFSLGISFLVLALFALADIDWMAPLKLIVFVALLGLTLKIFNGGKIGGFKFGKSNPSPLTSFAFGISILVLALYATSELPWVSVFKMLTFIVLLGIALKSFSGFKAGKFSMSKSSPTGLVGFAIGLGLMVLAMYAMSFLPFEAMFKSLVFITLFGLTMKLINKQTGMNMVILASGMLILAAAFMVISLAPMTLEKILIFGGSVLFMVGVAALIGIPAVSGLVALGSVVMILLSVSMLVAGGTIALVSALPINFGRLATFLGVISLMALTFALITPLALIGIIGSVLLIPMAVTALLLATTLFLIKGLTFDSVGAFLSAILGLATTFALITPLAILGLIGATLMMPIMLSALFVSAVLMSIQNLNISEKQLNSYNIGVISVVKTLDNFKIVSLAKNVVKSGMLIPIFATGLVAALTLRAISALNISDSKIGAFGEMMKKFVDVMITTINDNVDGLKKVEPGLLSLAKLIGVSAQLADVVKAFANLNYNVYEVKDGKLQLVAVRQITDAEMLQVGVNVGKLVQALLNPLAIIGNDDDYWDFGNGVKVQNPFKSRRTRKRIDRLEQLGNALMPLADAMEKFGSSSILQDKAQLEQFNTGLISVISTLTEVFSRLDAWENSKNAKKSLKTINEFVEIFDTIDANGLKSITDTMLQFVDTLSDDVKWTKIFNNLKVLKQDFKEIAQNINMLNLEKTLAFNNTLKLLSEKETNKNLKDVVEKLQELIGLMFEHAPQQSSGTTVINNTETKGSDNSTIVMTEVKAILSEINEGLNLANQKLGGKLKVVMINQNTGNSI
jgi:hypothetical protein